MATDEFRNIKTFRQLQEARRQLESQINKRQGKLWVPFALALVRGIKSRLTEE